MPSKTTARQRFQKYDDDDPRGWVGWTECGHCALLQNVDIVHTLILILPDKDSTNMTAMTPGAGWGGQSVDIVRSSSSAEPQVIDSQSWCLRDTLAQNDDDGNVDGCTIVHVLKVNNLQFIFNVNTQPE